MAAASVDLDIQQPRRGRRWRGSATNSGTWLVAIDIGQRFHAVLVEGPDGKRQRFQLASTREDYDRLVGFLQARSGPVRIALEPTGNLHRTLAYRLLREGFPVVSVSSVAGARYREAMFNSWDKNDPKDATVILHLLKQGIVQHYHDPLLAGDHDLQELSKTYQQITLARKRLADSLLNHYLPLYFPEMARYWESTRVAWFVAFLMQFPTPGAICVLSREAFVHAAGPLVGRKVHKRAKLDELYELAHRSIGLPVLLDSPAIETFRLQLEQLRRLADAAGGARSASAYPPRGTGRLPAPLLAAGGGLDPRLGHSRRGWGPAALPASPPVLEVLRLGPREVSVRAVPGPGDALQARQRPPPHGLLDGRPARRADDRELLPGQVRALHEAGSGESRCAAEGAHGRRRQDGAGGLCGSQAEPTVSRLSRACPAQRIDPSHAGRRGDRDPVDNAWTFRWDPTLY